MMAERKRVRIEAAGPRTGRSAIWPVIRRLGRFTVRDVLGEVPASIGQWPVRDYIRALAMAGYLKRDGQKVNSLTGKAATCWKLVKDVGVEAPHVRRRDGSEITAGRVREQMWRTMRMIGEFNHRELAINASTEEHPVSGHVAKNYVFALCRAGYLARVQAGAAGRLARFRLLPTRYSGPKPPMVKKDGRVLDLNLNKVMCQPGDGDA